MAMQTAQDIQSDQGSLSLSMTMQIEEEKEAMADPHNAGMKIERAKDAYQAFSGLQERPSKVEIWIWYLYEMCSHFIVTTLVPVVFPLIISQIVQWPIEVDDDQGWGQTSRGVACMLRHIKLFNKLTHRTISVSNLKFSAVEWTSISWFIGIILGSPLLGLISKHLDHGYSPQIIAGAATAIGSLFCLPVGFIRTPYIFPLYIAAIVASYTYASASHTRHLGLMVRGFTEPALQLSQFPIRRGASGWFSVYATAAGCLGSAIMSAFTFHMLRNKKDPLVSLWIVSIFSGLIWLIGMSHIATVRPGTITTTSHVPQSYFLSIFKYPYAIASLVVVFMSSFSSMCIFTGGLLFFLGQLCLKPIYFLYFWLIYFIFPSFSMPLLQPLQHVIKADSVRMQLLGSFLALLTSGMGFYYKSKNWQKQQVLIFAAIQSTSAGLLHAFGRVLLLDCTPHGQEGAFSVWHSWVKALGTCAGFAVASSALSGNVGNAFGVSFMAAMVGILILIFGNISDVDGAIAAGHLHHHSERGTPVTGLDTSIIIKEHAHEETVESGFHQS